MAFLAAAIVACALASASSAAAATDVVTTTADSGPGSLRETVAKAAAGDTIKFAIRVSGTIQLASPITIDKSLTIKGPSAFKQGLDGGGGRILEISGGDLALSGLILQGGKAETEGGALLLGGSGSLTVSSCVFSGNAAGRTGSAQADAPALDGAGLGGAIYAGATAGPVVVEDSVFEGNTVGGLGGSGADGGSGHGSAIWDLSSQPLRILGSTFVANVAGGVGGSGARSGTGTGTVGAEGPETVEVVNSLFQENRAGGSGGSGEESGKGVGAAVWAGPGSSLTISESEFLGNLDGEDGGSGAAAGAGLGAVTGEGTGSLDVAESVLQGNVAGGNGGSGVQSGAGFGAAIYAGPGRSVALAGSRLEGNVAGQEGGTGEESGAGFGGALAGKGAGSITVSESSFVGGVAGGVGGAARLSGSGNGAAISAQAGKSLAISGSFFQGNAAGGPGTAGELSGAGRGGAVFVDESAGPATIAESTFEENRSGAQAFGANPGSGAGAGLGGAIFAAADTSISATTFYVNQAGLEGSADSAAGFGGAVDFDLAAGVVASITNSTLVENFAGGALEAGAGGAVNAEEGLGTLTLASDTIVGNRVEVGGSGGDGSGSSIGGAAAVAVKATIVTAGANAPNCDEPVASSEYSFEGQEETETSCGLDLPSGADELETFGDNGGPTETYSLAATSPALDAVPGAACPETDQRGELRASRLSPVCDVGAYEDDPRTAPTITSAAAASFEVGDSSSFTVTTTGDPEPILNESGTLPAGLTFVDRGDGTAGLGGVPAAGTGGTYTIAIEASNGFVVKPEAVQIFTLTVVGPPAAAPAPNAPTESPSSTPAPASPASPSPSPPVPSLRVSHDPNRPHPANRKGGPRYTFTFSDGVPGSTYLCRLDRGTFKRCTSPAVYRNLKRGRHVFEVKSVTPAGLESAIRRVVFRAGKPKPTR